jgi:CheY-like chemotaxis protein
VLPDQFVPAPAIATVAKRAIRVLAVDDNQVNRIVIAELLKKAGTEYLILENGEVAIECIKKEAFDIVLMDCQMPVMDGYEATKAIRQWEKDVAHPSRLPIIALTANASSDDVQRCFDAGMDGYCAKPINPEALFKKIGELLEEKRT